MHLCGFWHVKSDCAVRFAQWFSIGLVEREPHLELLAGAVNMGRVGGLAPSSHSCDKMSILPYEAFFSYF